MNKLICRIFKTLMLVVATTAYASEEKPNNVLEIATSYITAMYDQDFRKVPELAAPDLQFESPTAEPGFVPSQSSRDAVIESWSHGMTDMEQEWEITRSFSSHDKAVFYMTTVGTAPGEFFGHEAKTVAYKVDGVAVVQVVNGLVVRHSGYMDYPAMFAGLRPVE